MQHKPTNSEIYTITLHLLAALNNVTICRHALDRGRRTGEEQRLRVPLTWSQKTRQYLESVQINGQYKLPAITVGLTGVSHDPSRNMSRNDDIHDNRWSGEDGFSCVRRPTPVTVSYALNAFSTKPDDLMQIIEHYTSVFNPDITVSWMNPIWPEELHSVVTWDGSWVWNAPQDVASDDDQIFSISTSFTMTSWIFRERKDNILPLNKVTFNLGLVEDCQCFLDGEDEATPAESFTESIVPEIFEVEPECVKAGRFVTIYGKNLSQIEGIYLQGDNIPTSSFEPFCFSESLSSQCPEFEAYEVPEYNVLDADNISIQIPEDFSDTELDILVTHRGAGCVKLSDSNECGDCEKNDRLVVL